MGTANDLSFVLVNWQLLRSLVLSKRRFGGSPIVRGAEALENGGEVLSRIEGVVLGKGVLRGLRGLEEPLLGFRRLKPEIFFILGPTTSEFAHHHLRTFTA